MINARYAENFIVVVFATIHLYRNMKFRSHLTIYYMILK